MRIWIAVIPSEKTSLALLLFLPSRHSGAINTSVPPPLEFKLVSIPAL